mgnify:CR=1 FL=1
MDPQYKHLTPERHGEGGVQTEDDLGHKTAQILVIGPAHEQSPAVRGVLSCLLAHPEGNRAEHYRTRHLRCRWKHPHSNMACHHSLHVQCYHYQCLYIMTIIHISSCAVLSFSSSSWADRGQLTVVFSSFLFFVLSDIRSYLSCLGWL